MGLSSLCFAQVGVRCQWEEVVSPGEAVAGGKSTAVSSSPASATTALLPQADKLLFIDELTAWKKTGEKPQGSILEEHRKRRLDHHPDCSVGRSNRLEGDTRNWQNQGLVKWELMVLVIQRLPQARLEKCTCSGPLGFSVPLHFSAMPEIFHGFKCFDNGILYGAK